MANDLVSIGSLEFKVSVLVALRCAGIRLSNNRTICVNTRYWMAENVPNIVHPWEVVPLE